mgnify:CR=1 FL=1
MRLNYQLKVQRARQVVIPERPSLADTHSTVKLFVGGLPNVCNLSELRAYFEQFGPLSDTCLPSQGSANAGFGFVTFKSSISVQRVLQQKQHFIRGKWVR